MNKEELLKIARQKYPSGTIMISDYSLEMGYSKQASTYTIAGQNFTKNSDGIQASDKRGFYPYIYYKNKWAEIVSLPYKAYELW